MVPDLEVFVTDAALPSNVKQIVINKGATVKEIVAALAETCLVALGPGSSVVIGIMQPNAGPWAIKLGGDMVGNIRLVRALNAQVEVKILAPLLSDKEG
jgi:hypothetical protein